ncbi:N-acyl-D-amino-acid deacylase family protein [Microbacterium halotolerans]|uniref:N-acyl-D-amino-acid deacylase family protein n=1 Tax=Microbacterium halotolerans TaxID=246613 RepID=UPI000E6ADA98|nr:amidohydrolase family protein [Microbacterium halotolerans]
MTRTVIRGGVVVDERAEAGTRADVAIADGRISEVGRIDPRTGDEAIDAGGRLVLPGFIDAHSHADGRVFDPEVQLALLRQGVTTVIAGQDGVSYAPGDGRWASDYFAAINGRHPQFRGGGTADLLATYDDATPVNVGFLVPAGTVRHEVMGMSADLADDEQLRRMQTLVADGLRDGALGLSTGLDYVPGLFADTAEIAKLTEPVAAADALYVTHMRGGYERGSDVGVREIAAICAHSGVAAHISHFHLDAERGWRLMSELADGGADASFDMYPYTRGASLLSMPTLPPEYSALAAGDATARLQNPDEVTRLRTDWFPRVAEHPSLGPDWPGMITISSMPNSEWAWCVGLTLAEVARRLGVDAAEATIRMLVAGDMRVGAVMAVLDERPMDNLTRLFSHPGFMGGSDGIFVGQAPHPRAYGAFARLLAMAADGRWTWQQAVTRLSERPAARMGLGRRGAVRAGFHADLVLVDPAAVADRADYANPLRLAEGIDDVLVAGVPVLAGGALTGRTPGRGLRRDVSSLTAEASQDRAGTERA